MMVCGRHINGKRTSQTSVGVSDPPLGTVFLRYAIAIGSLSKYESTQKKIEMGYKYKVGGK